eukprot:TRINITY_DN6895_c0_g1_i11.p1 TRINITY_DN6895_c0_g1~~TRINITY_DN6895_c0_g1_i11.p1  ORF type:complete len:516 (+),score=169.52 TRINITY_DN6895_c0_g1_i11:25-1548(+)
MSARKHNGATPADDGGFLLKRGESVKSSYKRRWFAMDAARNSMLNYSQGPEDKPLGSVDLAQVSSIQVEDEKKFGFVLETPARTYYLRATTTDEMNKWIGKLRAVALSVSKNSAIEEMGEAMRAKDVEIGNLRQALAEALKSTAKLEPEKITDAKAEADRTRKSAEEAAAQVAQAKAAQQQQGEQLRKCQEQMAAEKLHQTEELRRLRDEKAELERRLQAGQHSTKDEALQQRLQSSVAELVSLKTKMKEAEEAAKQKQAQSAEIITKLEAQLNALQKQEKPQSQPQADVVMAERLKEVELRLAEKERQLVEKDKEAALSAVAKDTVSKPQYDAMVARCGIAEASLQDRLCKVEETLQAAENFLNGKTSKLLKRKGCDNSSDDNPLLEELDAFKSHNAMLAVELKRLQSECKHKDQTIRTLLSELESAAKASPATGTAEEIRVLQAQNADLQAKHSALKIPPPLLEWYANIDFGALYEECQSSNVPTDQWPLPSSKQKNTDRSNPSQ